MRRGDLITVAMQGTYGKPRPALVIQATWIEGLDSVTFLPLTSKTRNVRAMVISLGRFGFCSNRQ